MDILQRVNINQPIVELCSLRFNHESHCHTIPGLSWNILHGKHLHGAKNDTITYCSAQEKLANILILWDSHTFIMVICLPAHYCVR